MIYMKFQLIQVESYVGFHVGFIGAILRPMPCESLGIVATVSHVTPSVTPVTFPD